MNRQKTRFVKSTLILISLGVSLLLSGCKLAILNPKGVIASEETRLLIDATLTMLIVVIPAMLLTVFISWRYSARNKKAKYQPNFSHSNVLEAIWWGIPICIIIVLATITWISSHTLDPYKPIQSKKSPLIIQVVSLNWKWLFIYPQQKIATVNDVRFPVNTPVEFQITSDAPMNSFQITQIAGQIYAMAGMRTMLHVMADAPGDYYGLSTSYSGEGFSDMHFVARVTKDNKTFQQWVNQVKQSNRQLNIASYQNLAKDSENNPITYYSNVSQGLFQFVINKYMDPKLKKYLPKPTTMASNSNLQTNGK